MPPTQSKSFQPPPPLSRQATTIAVGALGAAVFVMIGVPGGAISGAMVAVTLMTVFGQGVRIEGPVRLIAMVISGVTLGAAVSPETLRGVTTYPASLLIMTVGVVVTTVAGTWFLVAFAGWSRATALLASSPGAFAYILSVAPQLKADVPRIVVVQMFRVLILMAVLPLLMLEAGVGFAAQGAVVVDPLWLVAVMLVCGAAGSFVFDRLRIAGGVFFGAMLVSAVFHGTGLAPGRLPAPMTYAGKILIGCWTGSRFVGFDWRRLPALATAAFGSIAISLASSAAFAVAAAWLLNVPFGAATIAFAPGALEAMTMLAFAIGFDPLYVGVHHLSRFMLLNVSMPFVVRYWLQKK